MDQLKVFLLALGVAVVGVLLLGFFAGRLAFNYRGKPLAIQRPVVWSLGLWTAGQAWAQSTNALVFAAMLLALMAWDSSPLRKRATRYTE